MKEKSLPVHGFTLIELMVTIAIAVILMTVAVPGFVAFQRSSELTSIANNLLVSISMARTEAGKRNAPVLVVPGDYGTDWATGWVVFADNNRDGVYNSNGDTIISTQPAPPSYIVMTGNGTTSENPSYIRYDGSGFSKTKAGGFDANTIQIARNDTASTDYSQIRRLKIASTGRVRICTPKTATDTKCAATKSD